MTASTAILLQQQEHKLIHPCEMSPIEQVAHYEQAITRLTPANSELERNLISTYRSLLLQCREQFASDY
ncbi:hypothetical protein [endosymbiont of Ridgeia piscesae]|jgi:hypothetical protein|uniref:Uncharacterized protein n=1 Tax=endosymbiont of Ridgeia piscesae TaxID=54398 RepID=A0A0T5Z6M1_9GAMM|nr:hypothetical protein [endosymbiont of Ridgeia piscesae]KRT54738.1 hypothetical protein Ga0074115_10943 [endosymbiont of Ridgeia piscesae]KRT58230.1 hypothetical protein Ga0076813_130610 [endosymbiont of Ridgeia piscesae]